jgi:hypothetical protein
MQQDKKIAELEQEKVWEQEKMLEQEAEIEQEKELEKEKEFELIENEIETSEVLEKKKRREVIFEMALFFILGVLLGITIKTEAVKKITIGFNDYQITKPLQSYDVADMKKKLDEQLAKQQAEQEALQQQPTATQQAN